MSKALNDTVIINGKESKISYNKSRAKEWTIEDSNYDTIKLIDELLKNEDSTFYFKEGITVLNPVATIQIAYELDITRPSNHIGIIRHELPSDTIITYNVRGDKKPKYGLMKSDRNIEEIKNLKKKILQQLELKENTKNIQKQFATNRADS